MDKVQLKSTTKLVGLGAGIYFAYKQKKTIWGFAGYGLLGLILGSIVGNLITKTVVGGTRPGANPTISEGNPNYNVGAANLNIK